LKLVIDTNMLVAAMFNARSASARILRSASGKACRIMWHRTLRREAEWITGKISRSVPGRTIDLDQVFLPENEVVSLPEIRGEGSCDPEDNKFLACAEAAGVDLIVSNDSDLLTLGSYGSIPICTPSQALEDL
jgi:putative PIN family toxin of toxin-antitoxin system